MKKKFHRLLSAVLASVMMLSVVQSPVLAADIPAQKAESKTAVSYKRSGLESLPELSRAEMAKLNQYEYRVDKFYELEPVTTGPNYAPGKVTQAALDQGLARMNQMRRMAGLKPVVLDDALNELSQYGTVLLARHGALNHEPPKPNDMSQEFYEKGYKSTSSSNLSEGGTGADGDYNPLVGAIGSYIEDSDYTNIDRLGHRRWVLNPGMGKTGMGSAAGFCALYAFDSTYKNINTDYEFIGWPASGCFLNEVFPQNFAWSVTVNPERYQTPVKSEITVTLEGGGKTWTFSGKQTYNTNSAFYMNVETSGFGVPNCIIFRPDGIDTYQGLYTVTIDGLKNRNGNPVPFSYQVDFFNQEDLKPKVTVHYDANGGTGEFPDQIVNQGEEFLLPRKTTFTPPSPEYGFTAWEVNGVQYPAGKWITLNEDAVVKAIWHIHDWEWKQHWDSNYHYQKCKICGEETQKQQHSYGPEWKHDSQHGWQECVCGKIDFAYKHVLQFSDVKDPTCTTPGTRIGRCWRCGYEEKQEWSAPLGHTLQFVAEVPATCDAPGTVEHWHCNRLDCGKNYQDQQATKELTDEELVIPAAGHDWNPVVYNFASDASSCTAERVCKRDASHKETASAKVTGEQTKAPTCTQKGETTYTAVFAEPWAKTQTKVLQDVEITGHTFGPDWKYDAQNHWKECSCGEKSEIAKHTFTETVIKPATCTQDGEKEQRCSCGYSYKETIPATGHKLTVHPANAADCTHSGTVEYWSCDKCGAEFADANGTTPLTDKTSPALGHKMIHYARVPATCTQDGTVEYWHCERCGKDFADANGKTPLTNLVEKATGHSFGEWTVTKEATCTEQGEQTRTCKVCNAAETQEIPLKPHTMNPEWEKNETSHWHSCTVCHKQQDTAKHSFDKWIIIKEATETETGLKEHSCTVCGYKEQQEIPLKEHVHQFGDWMKNETNHWKECACGEKAKTAAHTYNETITTPAGCTTEGAKTFTCTVCGYSYIETIPATGHSFGEWKVTTAPACEKEGTETCTCAACGATKTRPVPALQHSYERAVTTEPTCTTEGLATFTCKTCGKQYTEIIPALGHKLTNHPAVDATCTEAGNPEYWNCETCHKNFADAKGEKELSNEQLVIPALGHKMTHHDRVPATCEKDGTVEYWSCEQCGKNFADKEGTTILTEIAEKATGHHWSEWKVTTEPTCTEKGTETRICTACGKAETRVMEALGHSMIHENAAAPTENKSGWVEHWHCLTCGKNFADEKGVAEIANVMIDPLPAKPQPEAPAASAKPAESSFDWQTVRTAIAGINTGIYQKDVGNEIAVPHYIWQSFYGRNVTVTFVRGGDKYVFNGLDLARTGFDPNNGHNLTDLTGYIGRSYTASNLVQPETENEVEKKEPTATEKPEEPEPTSTPEPEKTPDKQDEAKPTPEPEKDVESNAEPAQTQKTDSGLAWWIWLLIAAAVLLVVWIIVLATKRRKDDEK